MLSDEELALVIMKLETESLSPDVYRYRTDLGLSVVYYIFDAEKLERLVFEPVYMLREDVRCLDRSEDELFQIILGNTVAIMETVILPFSVYLTEFEGRCWDIPRLTLIKKIAEAMERAGDEEKLWCVTSNIRERGASGGLYTPLLKQFCKKHHIQQLLLGFSNNDFTFLSFFNPERLADMDVLVSKISHVIDGEDVVVKKKILLYDCGTDSLKLLMP